MEYKPMNQMQDQQMNQYYEDMMVYQMQQMMAYNMEYMSDPINFIQVYPNNNFNHEFKRNTIRAKDYDDWNDIVKHLPHLKTINSSNPDTLQQIVSKNNVYFIMRSTNDDDIHKAIKHQVWCSSTKNNQLLSETYKEAQRNGQDVYLIYSVVRSYQFCGIAKMVSDLQSDQSFRFWWEENKYFGSFRIKWVYVKDINDKVFNHIKQQDDIPISRLRDSTKIDLSIGNKIITIFHNHRNNLNIFQSFAYMDKREDIKMSQRENDIESTTQFDDLAALYKESPLNFQQKKKRIAKNPNGLFNNPYYSQKKKENGNAQNIEEKFVVKNREKQPRHRAKHNKRKTNKVNEYSYQPDTNANVVVNQSESEDEVLEQNDNSQRPVE